LKQVLAALEAMVTLVLVVVAIVGIAYHSFREGGLIAQGFGKITSAYVSYPISALAITILAFFAVRAWRNRELRGTRASNFDYIIYAMMALGIYFIGHYVITGEF
jgi:ABC-type dipeptide/oligopeptide/nickel transport system permease component